jgi:S-adenosylmethionine hydrolase
MGVASLRFVGSLVGAIAFLAMIGCQPPASSDATAPASSADSPGPQPVVALLTDYGGSDSYVAQMKGAILTIDPAARLLDLTHEVTPYDVAEGSYLLDQSAQEFPAGTIFVAVVDPEVGTDRAALLVKSGQGKFYVGPDNGLFTRVLDREGVAAAWTLDKPEYFRAGGDSRTFHGRDIFGPVAAHLAQGTDPAKMGTPLAAKALTLLPPNEPELAGGVVSATVLHVDHYGNVILNFRGDSEPASKFKMGNLVKITVRRDSFSGPLVKTYGDGEKGRLILLYGNNGLLEIAVNQGSAVDKIKVGPGDAILLKP